MVITGSLGHISRLLTEELVKKGHRITLISSKEDKKRDIEATGATPAIGSLEDPEFLVNIFKGADAVYLMVPPNMGVPDIRLYYNQIGDAYKQAIEKSAVKRAVLLSSIGADLESGTGLILGSHDVETKLNALPDLSMTILRPGYFYYNLYAFADMIKDAGFIATNYGEDTRFPLVSVKDIAAVAAEEMEKTSNGKSIRYIASEDRTASDVARVIGKAIGKPDLKWVKLTSAQMQEGLEKSGLPKSVVSLFVEMGESIQTGRLRKDFDLHRPAEMGKVKLEQFAKEFADAF